jgi:hypothetical protein
MTKTLSELAASNLLRVACLVFPLGAFALLWRINILERWKYETAGGIIVVCVAFLGYRMWKTRRTPVQGLDRQVFHTVFTEHAIMLILGLLMLDGGIMAYACIVAVASYWMTVGVIVANRPTAPTPFDVQVVSLGYLVLAITVTTVYYTTLSYRGY